MKLLQQNSREEKDVEAAFTSSCELVGGVITSLFSVLHEVVDTGICRK